jgi:hypothetical protein
MGLFYDIASYVHRIAGGANPSDMPIEQSPRFYMAVNLKTAALLGVSLSDAFVARAKRSSFYRLFAVGPPPPRPVFRISFCVAPRFARFDVL